MKLYLVKSMTLGTYSLTHTIMNICSCEVVAIYSFLDIVLIDIVFITFFISSMRLRRVGPDEQCDEPINVAGREEEY